jgi:hypothetical protein
MSLGIALKGPEGIVLAADSRVTLFSQMQMPNQPQMLIPASFDNATKLLRAKGHDFVAAVTYGQGAIGQQQPRTAHSFLPEFEQELGEERLKVQEFAKRLGDFFMKQWQSGNMPITGNPENDMIFLVGGYTEKEPYGEVYEVHVPSNPVPAVKVPVGQFGMVLGGQRNITDRIVQGFDSVAINVISDYAIFLIRSTILLQRWIVDVRGVGGAVDVATITRTEGFKPVQLKQIEPVK